MNRFNQMITGLTKLKFSLPIMFLITTGAFGGGYVKKYAPWPVYQNAQPVAFPFFGGLNNPKPVLLDLDSDNLVDLLIGEANGNIVFLKNFGQADSPDWQPVQDRLGAVDAGTWYTFCDIDADGDHDLFCDSRTTKVRYFRNDSVDDSLFFTLIDTAFGDFIAGSNNTPAFADLDGDNDFDFFYGNTFGQLEFYENVGDSANPSFTFVTDFYDSVYAFPGAGGTLKSLDNRHGFSNISFADIDSDNDLDLFWGDIFNFSLYLFRNDGLPDSSALMWETETYLQNQTTGFNHVTFSDLDADNDLDMILGVAGNAEKDNLRLLRNIGLPILASFVEEDANIIDQIDFGSTTFPAAGDIDGDGDLDLLVGSLTGQIAFLKNTGTKYAPEFTLESENYKSIDVGSSSLPHLVDWDSDGDLDLLIGNQSGRIEYWRNDGTAVNFNPVLATNQLGAIKTDQLAVPVTADLNNDSLLDLVVGEWDFNSFANICLYKNTGSPGNPQLTLVTNSLIKREIREFAQPTLFDWNNDGALDLIVGGPRAGLKLYLNEAPVGAFPDSNSFVFQPDSLIPGHDDGWRLAALFVDLDNDNDADVFIGEENGGLNYYEDTFSCCEGIRGNIDGSPDGIIDVSDLLFLVDFMFFPESGVFPDCLWEADVNADGANDIGDLLYLVDYMFFVPAGPPPADCVG